jgi:uncharacterized membrane protein YeiH
MRSLHNWLTRFLWARAVTLAIIFGGVWIARRWEWGLWGLNAVYLAAFVFTGASLLWLIWSGWIEWKERRDAKGSD